jgi:hypothetical protein
MKNLSALALFLFLTTAGFAGELQYRLEYQICGSAVSRLLFFLPLRVYYDTSASINLSASLQPDGKARFVFANIPRSAYLLRTLGFSGRTLALFSADTDEARAGNFRDNILSLWRKEAPEYAARVKSVRAFPHLLTKGSGDGLSFSRDSEGRYGDLFVSLETRYAYYPSRTGIYFNIFPILGELLKMLNHPYTPGLGIAQVHRFPPEWNGDWLNFSSDFNRLGTHLEKIVKSLVTVTQQFPFRLKFRVSECGPDEVEICGEAFPDVPLWKSFMIREAFRRVRVRLADGILVLDEIWVGIRNNKGQGGFGRLRLQLLN